MRSSLPIACMLSCIAAAAWPAPPAEKHDFTSIETEFDGEAPSAPVAGKVLQDTIWIADWSFDEPGGGCTEAGWVSYDNRIKNDGSNYWSINSNYAGAGNGTITGNVAVLGKHDLCWVSDGYGDDWDYSIVLEYAGASATLGRTVRVLADGAFAAGRNHRVAWDGFDAAGKRAASGVYIYRLRAGDFTATRKMIVLK